MPTQTNNDNQPQHEGELQEQQEQVQEQPDQSQEQPDQDQPQKQQDRDQPQEQQNPRQPNQKQEQEHNNDGSGMSAATGDNEQFLEKMMKSASSFGASVQKMLFGRREQQESLHQQSKEEIKAQKTDKKDTDSLDDAPTEEQPEAADSTSKLPTPKPQ